MDPRAYTSYVQQRSIDNFNKKIENREQMAAEKAQKTAKYFRDVMRDDALNICLHAAGDIPNVKEAMGVVDRLARGFRANHANMADILAKSLHEKYAPSTRPAIKQCFDCDWMDRRAVLEAVHESYDIFLDAVRNNHYLTHVYQDDSYVELAMPPVTAGLILLDLTTSLLEPVMLAKDEGQEICTILACYEATMESLRSWCAGEGVGSAERITTKALALLDNREICYFSGFKEQYDLFMRNVLQQLESRFGEHAARLDTLENLLPLKAPTVSFGAIREGVLLCIECGVLRRSNNVEQSELDAWKKYCSTLEQPENYDVKQTLQMCPAAYPSIRLLLRTYLSVISNDGNTSSTNSPKTALLQTIDPSMSKWAIAKERLQIVRPVGAGVSSKVHLAEFRFGTTAYTTRSVAVKSVFDAEHSVMREAGFLGDCKHANIVEFIGFYVDSVGTHIVTEFMPGGDLSNYLANEQSHPTIREALSYCTQIAQAMAYLTKKHIIHGDLAARNCLLDEYQVSVKVSDFGLCRRSDEFYEYHTIKARLLPFRWCAPECVADVGKYSEGSDVWAFGVTLWEVFSRCSEPYGKDATCDDVFRHINEGNRLLIPPCCPPEVQ